MSFLDPRPHWQATREVFDLLVRHRQLTWEMAKREVSDRYAGQALGVLWAVAHPLLLMGVYLFIFAFVFRIKIERADGIPLNYAVYLLSGLIPWLGFQESMNKGATATQQNANLVKQVVFPVEILPVKGVVASLLPLGTSLAILILYCLISFGQIPATYALLPVLVGLQFLGMAGASFLLSAVGTYFRDLKDVVQAFTVMGVYLMPTFYLPDMVPGLFRPLLYLNPFSYMVWCYQDVCYFGRIEHPWAWPVFALLCTGSFYAGYRTFRKLKPYFGNVL